MTLNDLLPLLKDHSAIVVTGPQRSGTTIAAHILAEELGYTYVDENDFGIHQPERLLPYLNQGWVVAQAPGLFYVADQLPATIIVMRRPLEDIHRSEARIHWREEHNGANLKVEQEKYRQLYGVWDDDVAWLKYYVWDHQQAPRCAKWFDLDYESLAGHRLWVAERRDFGARQWRHGE